MHLLRSSISSPLSFNRNWGQSEATSCSRSPTPFTAPVVVKKAPSLSVAKMILAADQPLFSQPGYQSGPHPARHRCRDPQSPPGRVSGSVRRESPASQGARPEQESATENANGPTPHNSSGRFPGQRSAKRPSHHRRVLRVSVSVCSRVGPTLQKILDTYPQDVRIVFKNFTLPGHRAARPAAEAALAAAAQGKFWEYHDLLFANSRQLIEETSNGGPSN